MVVQHRAAKLFETAKIYLPLMDVDTFKRVIVLQLPLGHVRMSRDNRYEVPETITPVRVLKHRYARVLTFNWKLSMLPCVFIVSSLCVAELFIISLFVVH